MKPKNRLDFGKLDIKVSKKTKHVNREKEERGAKSEERRKKDLIAAGTIYKAWKRAFCSTPCAPESIPVRMMALRDELAKKIKGRRTRAVFLQMVEDSIEKAMVLYGPKPGDEGFGEAQ